MSDIDIENGITTINGVIDEDGYLNVLWELTDEELKGVIEARSISMRIPINVKPTFNKVEVYYDKEEAK